MCNFDFIIFEMVQIKGQYFNGNLTLKEPVVSEKPLDVIVSSPDVEQNAETPLDSSQFGFTKAQELLKSFTVRFPML